MFHFTKAVLKAGGPIIGSYFAWMRKYAKHPDKYPFEERFGKVKKILTKVSNSLAVDYYVEGLEFLPEETCCLVCNHLSALDPVALIINLKKPCTFVGKKELLKRPFIGKIMTGLECQFIDRDDLKQSLRVMMKVEEDLKKRQRDWIIFPEGTRNKDEMHNLGEFHHGTFRPAFKAGVPIVPIALYGSFRALKEKPQFKRYPVFMKILKPIYPEEYQNMSTQEIALKVQNEIEKAVSYDLRKKDHEYMVKHAKKYRFNQII